MGKKLAFCKFSGQEGLSNWVLTQFRHMQLTEIALCFGKVTRPKFNHKHKPSFQRTKIPTIGRQASARTLDRNNKKSNQPLIVLMVSPPP